MTIIHSCSNMHSWITMLSGYLWFTFDIRNTRVAMLKKNNQGQNKPIDGF
jgi:hypothetical protein